ncbi:hypothetical protein [Duganella qianjiadongensis]|uniref:DUF2059 domain-containing protein n=1 Tax=Duganella qianjiadongensis TaxID=2692176 RepID=A0ABW9VJF9_9BURK|nr:hypothetical protein [Duganella qianjiadongensis]MYM37742.1 hypothetical protein [Duganella qianjiadongensis]
MNAHARTWIFAVLLGISQVSMASSSEQAAVELVQRQHLGNNLKMLGLATAQKTQTFAMMGSRLGQAEAQVLVSKELDAYLGQYQGPWNANLAKIYARHFTAEELTSLVNQGNASPFIAKLMEKQSIIGREMQQLSTPILTDYVSAAMNSAFAKFSKK